MRTSEQQQKEVRCLSCGAVRPRLLRRLAAITERSVIRQRPERMVMRRKIALLIDRLQADMGHRGVEMRLELWS
jgi:hypothetical protein